MRKLLGIALGLLAIGVIGMMISSLVFGFGSNGGDYNHKETLDEPFNQIEIDVKMLTLDVTESKDQKSHIIIENAKDENQIKYEVQDDILKLSSGDSGWADININVGLINLNDELKVELQLPEKQYERIDIQNDVGSIHIDKLFAKQSKIDVDFGDVIVHEVDTEDLIFNVDVGDLELRSVNKDTSMKGDVNVGNADIYYKEKPDNVTVQTDTNVGEIELNNVFPNSGIVGDGKYNIDLEANVGDIQVELE